MRQVLDLPSRPSRSAASYAVDGCCCFLLVDLSDASGLCRYLFVCFLPFVKSSTNRNLAAKSPTASSAALPTAGEGGRAPDTRQTAT